MNKIDKNLHRQYKPDNISQQQLTLSHIQKNEVHPDFVFLYPNQLEKEYLLSSEFLARADLKAVSWAVERREDRQITDIREAISTIEERAESYEGRVTRNEKPTGYEPNATDQRSEDIKNACPEMAKEFTLLNPAEPESRLGGII